MVFADEGEAGAAEGCREVFGLSQELCAYAFSLVLGIDGEVESHEGGGVFFGVGFLFVHPALYGCFSGAKAADESQDFFSFSGKEEALREVFYVGGEDGLGVVDCAFECCGCDFFDAVDVFYGCVVISISFFLFVFLLF